MQDFNVFLSWSGDRARRLAEAFKVFLEDANHFARAWISTRDIDKGRWWESELFTSLGKIKTGVICLTPESQREPWPLFETGVMAREIDKSLICPYLLGLEIPDLIRPYRDLQATKTTKGDTLEMMRSINKALGDNLPDHRLEKMIERSWPDLDSVIRQLEKQPAPTTSRAPPKKDVPEILEELFKDVRELRNAQPPVSSLQGTAAPLPLAVGNFDFVLRSLPLNKLIELHARERTRLEDFLILNGNKPPRSAGERIATDFIQQNLRNSVHAIDGELKRRTGGEPLPRELPLDPAQE